MKGPSGAGGWGLGSLLLAGVASSALTTPAEALTIVPTYTTLVSSSARSAFAFAAGEYQSLFTDPVTVNITVNTGTTGLGGSSTPLQFVTPTATYGSTRTALINDYAANPSAARTIAESPGGSINTTTDPTGGASFIIPFAEAKAVGLRTANNAASDGTFTYNRNRNPIRLTPPTEWLPGNLISPVSPSMKSPRSWAGYRGSAKPLGLAPPNFCRTISFAIMGGRAVGV